MSAVGVEVKHGKYLAFKMAGQERFIRCKSIGADYTEDAIRERISGKRVVAQKRRILASSTSERPHLLIDIQARIQEGYGGKGFEHWATIENLKAMSKTLIYLQERGLDDYELLTTKAEVVSESFRK
jgi:hypothetical protein